MNDRLLKTRLRQGFIAFVVLWTAISIPSQAAADTPGPVAVEITLASGSAITQGEPVVLHYKMTNAATRAALAYTGRSGEDWLTTSLSDENGKPVPLSTNRRRISIGGIHSDGLMISPHDYQQGDVVVMGAPTVPHPGKYTLSVHVHLPYGSGTPETFIPAARLEQVGSPVVTQDYRFPLVVTQADPVRLQATADKLRGLIMAGSVQSHYNPATLIKALVSMPEAVALPVLASLAADPKLSNESRIWVASELSHLHMIQAADILADMHWNPAATVDERGAADAGSFLTEMYNAADAPLKQHIKALYAAHGIQLPEQVPNMDQD